MEKEPLPRLDEKEDLKKELLKYCRLKPGQVWEDPVNGHRVGVLDAAKPGDVGKIMQKDKADLVVNDPPYNIVVGNRNTGNIFRMNLDQYIEFSRNWIKNCIEVLADNANFYIWLGADQTAGFQPLPDFMIMMREFCQLESRSFITVRNQRGYGTQSNWMAVRQELLYYIKGNPFFKVAYTDIPKILKGYYKEIDGKITENMERSKSEFIRPGNVWVDIQQVFYRMKENVPGAYVQKPLKSISRILETSSEQGGIVLDEFAHSGTTLIAAEMMKRKCYTFDIDPVFAELTIRRLLNYRKTGEPGWQVQNPFPEAVNKT